MGKISLKFSTNGEGKDILKALPELMEAFGRHYRCDLVSEQSFYENLFLSVHV